MANNIPISFVNSYKSNVIRLYQQDPSKLREIGRVESPTGEVHFFEMVAPSEMQPKTVRHSEQEIVDSIHSRRAVYMNEFWWADYIDKEDRLKMLIDPQGSYTLNAHAAANRKIDGVIYTATRGPAYSGKTGVTAVNLDTPNKIAHGSAGLTIEKVVQSARMLTSFEVPMEGRYFVFNAFGLEDLLAEPEVTSQDYAAMKALTTGSFNTLMGFTWVLYNFAAESSVYYSVACHRESIGIAIPMEPSIEVDRLPTKHYLTQVYLSMSVGATRIQENGVVEVAFQ